MLATMPKGKFSTDMTLKIMDTFVEMRRYISNNLFDVSKALSNLGDRVKVLEKDLIKVKQQVYIMKYLFMMLISIEVYKENVVPFPIDKVKDIIGKDNIYINIEY